MLNLITFFCYLTGGIIQFLLSLRNKSNRRAIFISFGIPAILMHGYLLYTWIDLGAGQNLTEVNLLSLATWVAAIIITLIAIKKPVAYLGIFIFPAAASSIFFASYFPSSHIIQTANDPKQFFHIILSVITFSVLAVAGLQAVTLAFQEKFIRQKYFVISQTLPPLESMEKLLFQIIAIGLVLLSLVLGTSIYFFHSVLLQQFLQKTILTLVSWLVFTSLLVGRRYFGWRGKKAIYCTLGGVTLLSIIYFSSIIIMGLLP